VASRIALACAAFGAFTAPAVAADLNDYPSTPASRQDAGVYVPSFSWTGLYLGGHLGYSSGDSYSRDNPNAGAGAAFDNNYEKMTIEPDGWLGGGQIGYNWQYSTLLFGFEADAGYLGAEADTVNALGFVKSEYSWYGTTTGRLGFVDGRWLFYGKGGLAFADIRNEASAMSGGAIDSSDYTSIDEVRAGWAAGGGIEYAFQRDWSMKVEYLYMDFGDDRSTNIDGDSYIHDNSIHTVKVGLNYKLQTGSQPLR
jgi:outer membrane immunogenic protein